MREKKSKLFIVNGRVITPFRVLERGTLVIEEGRILGVEEKIELPEEPQVQVIEAGGRIVAPGFIDIHIHGVNGFDTMDATSLAIKEMAKFLVRFGVTAFLPTTVTASREAIIKALINVFECPKATSGGAEILGVHLEGPYISPSQAGAQPPSFIRPARRLEYKEFFSLGNVRVITLAPETPGSRELIVYAVKQGATVALGHSSATYNEVLEVVKIGLRHSVHAFNGMGGLHHREPGTVGAVLTCDEISAEAIADNIHLHPAILKLLFSAKGAHNMVLVTDAIRATGMPDGIYDLGGQKVLVKDRVARLSSGSLAGSTLTMDKALREMMKATNITLPEALRLVSCNPARVIGRDGEKGSLEPGKDADIVFLDEEHRVVLTMVAGKVVYKTEGDNPFREGLKDK